MSDIKSQSSKLFLVLLVWLVIAGIGITAVWFCKFRSKEKLQVSTSGQSLYKYEVRIHADWFSGYCILRSEEFKNQLRNEGIKLIYEDDAADYEARLKAFRDGRVDIAPFPINSLIEMGVRLKEFPATMVMFIDETKGADAIVAYKSAVGNLDDLNKEKAKFVLTPGSPSEYLARIIKADLDMSKISDKWIEPADGAAEVYDRFKKASKSEQKAFVMWEPYVSMALKNSDAHVIFGSDKIKGHIVDSLVVRREFLTENYDVVRTIVECYLKVAYSYKDDMVELVMKDAKAAGEHLSKDEAISCVKGIWWKNTLENYAHFRLLSRHESQGLEDVEEIIEKIAKVLVVTGAIDNADFQAHTLFYNRILEELQSSDFHPGQKLGIVSGTDALEQIRADAKLPALSDDEWDKLIPVGKMRIKSLSFRRGTSDLNIQSRRDLEELAKKLNSMPQYYLLVIGHSRAEGDIEANMYLAENRAGVAAQYLIQRQGISRNRIHAVAAKPSGSDGSSQSVKFQLMQRAY